MTDAADKLMEAIAAIQGLPLPVLSAAEIDTAIATKYPKMPGERKCAHERWVLNQLRLRYRTELEQQNIANEQYNRSIRTTAGRVR